MISSEYTTSVASSLYYTIYIGDCNSTNRYTIYIGDCNSTNRYRIVEEFERCCYIDSWPEAGDPPPPWLIPPSKDFRNRKTLHLRRRLPAVVPRRDFAGEMQ